MEVGGGEDCNGGGCLLIDVTEISEIYKFTIICIYVINNCM